MITNEMPGSPMEEVDQGVFIHRVAIPTPAPNFHSWVLLMNHYFAKRAAFLSREYGPCDIVHAHDWLVLPASSETKHFLGCTMVCTLHSLEYKRSGGVNSPEGYMIESFEWWLTYESSLVIVCSDSMKSDTKLKYSVPEDKLVVIPIGVDPAKFQRSGLDRGRVRAELGIGPLQKFALFVGRLTHQKGCEYLIRAIPSVSKYYDIRLIVVGEGYLRGDLEQVAKSTGEPWRIAFRGFLPDSDAVELMLSSDVMVMPSVYEPFGVVALEAMAARIPVVASQVDGLAEIVSHERTGLLVYPRDPSSISWGISRIFSDPQNTRRLVENAYEELSKRFTWDAVAAKTLECYARARR